MNYSSWPVEELFITEAARIAIALQLNKSPNGSSDNPERRRTFWVIYCIEKEYSFNSTQSSVSRFTNTCRQWILTQFQVFNDSDISCPPLQSSMSNGQGINWLYIQVTLCRILSKAYGNLFSPNAIFEQEEACTARIKSIRDELDQWLLLVPEEYRPGCPLRHRNFTKPHLAYATLQVHFLYYNLQIALSRLQVHVSKDRRCAAVATSKLLLLEIARAIMDTTQFIPLEASTPMK